MQDPPAAGDATPVEPHMPARIDLLAAAQCLLEAYSVLSWNHSQHAEDLLLLPTLVAAARGRSGRFVELGALDGVSFSNTLLLERCFGWQGLLIEANPTNFGQLSASGRRAVMRHSAVCSGPDGFVNVSKRGGAVAGMASVRSAFHRSHFASQTRGEMVQVPCTSLTGLMAEAGLPKANFLSLDVEGAEALVLAAVDPGVFDLIVVERDSSDADRMQRVHTLITQAGLQRADSLHVPYSLVYVRRGVVERPLDRTVYLEAVPGYKGRVRPARRLDAAELARLLALPSGSNEDL